MLVTPLTEMLNIKYPIMLAGMAGISLAEVVAAFHEVQTCRQTVDEIMAQAEDILARGVVAGHSANASR